MHCLQRENSNSTRKVCAEHKLCFSCLGKNQNFRQCPRPRKYAKENFKSTHNVLLHEAEKVFSPRKHLETPRENRAATEESSNGFTMNGNLNKCGSAATSVLASPISVKGLLQIVEIQLEIENRVLRTFALCDSACSH